MSVVVRHVDLPRALVEPRRATYLWQVQGLRAGELLTTTGGTAAVLPALADRRHATGSSSRSTPSGWPGVMLVADVLFGSPADGDRVGDRARGPRHVRFTREVTRDHTPGARHRRLMLASPMLITQSGVYLGYLFSLGLGLLFGAALFAGVRRAAWWLLVAAGVFLGVALHHPTVRRRALGRGDGRVRDLHHVAAVGAAGPRRRARASSGSCRSWC